MCVGFIPFERTDIETIAQHSTQDGTFSMARFSTEGMAQVNPLLTFRCLPNMPNRCGHRHPLSPARWQPEPGTGLELFSMPDMVHFLATAQPASHVHPLLFLQSPSDICVSLIGCEHELGRPFLTHVSACAAATDAIGSAFHLMRAGRRSRMSAPHPQGDGAVLSMQRALEDAGVAPADISYINAHGTSTPKNDIVETLAIRRVLGHYAETIPISAIKSMLGHCISAAGAVELAATMGCAQAGWAHPTINLDHSDPLCDLDYVAAGARAVPVTTFLKNSFAFGGQNASLVVRMGADHVPAR